VSEDRFLILTVAYERYVGRGLSLESIAPELKDAGLSLIEDSHHGWNRSRKWAGVVDGPTFDRLAAAWHLPHENDKPAPGNPAGDPTMHAHTLDGMNWETQGESPIIFVTVQVWVAGNGHEPRTRAHQPLPFVHVG